MLSIAEKKLANIDVTKDDNFKSYIKRRALGVVFVIAPWNYPYLSSSKLYNSCNGCWKYCHFKTLCTNTFMC